jgi:required for meiotic nuclear division protein 1
MSLVNVHAYAFAATFKLRDLQGVFPSGTVDPRIKERLVAALGPRQWALAYDFGALVFVGVEPGEQVRFVSAVEKLLPREPHPPLTESFTVEINDAAGPPEVRFDRVVVKDLTIEIVDIVALVLAQSVAMDYYAQDVEEIEIETDKILHTLRTRGRLPGRLRGLPQFIGMCIATRNDVISTLALFDKPDATWENEQLDRLWNDLYRMLELDDRYRTLDTKLRMFQDNLVVLVDLARGRDTLFLEVMVVLLILIEVFISMWSILTGARH